MLASRRVDSQRAGDARDVARLALAGDVAQRVGVDLAVAVAVVVGAHVLGEVVGALEALLARVFAHPVVHLARWPAGTWSRRFTVAPVVASVHELCTLSAL